MPPLSRPAGGSLDTPRYVLQWISDFALAKWVHQPYWPLEDLNISPGAKLTATSTASRNFPQPAPSSAERRRRFGGERSPVHSRDAAGSLRGSEMRSHRHFACPVQPQASKRLSWPFFRTHMSLGLDAQHLKPYGHKSLKLSPSRATSQFWLKKSPSFWCSTFIEININFLGLNPALSKNWRYPTLWSYHAVSRKWMEMMQHQTRGCSMVISTTRTMPSRSATCWTSSWCCSGAPGAQKPTRRSEGGWSPPHWNTQTWSFQWVGLVPEKSRSGKSEILCRMAQEWIKTCLNNPWPRMNSRYEPVYKPYKPL